MVIEGPQCVGGVATPWTVTPQTVDGVSYVLDPPGGVYQVPAVVTVTATLAAEGVAWDLPLPPGWLPGDPAATVATLTVSFQQPCVLVTPADPVVSRGDVHQR